MLKMNKWCALLFFIACIFPDNAVSTCLNSPVAEVCATELPAIPYLSSRDPTIMMSNKTSNWTFCDVYAIQTQTWYRSESPMTTSCPPMYTCGTKFPVWMNGLNPEPHDGIVNRKSCLRDFDLCCLDTYKLAAVNCMEFMAYCFIDLPSGCHQRYCFDLKKPELTTTEPFSQQATSNTNSPHSFSTSPVENHGTSSISQTKETTVSSTGSETDLHGIKKEYTDENKDHTIILVACMGLMFSVIVGLVVVILRRKRLSKVTEQTVNSITIEKYYQSLHVPGISIISLDKGEAKTGVSCGLTDYEILKHKELIEGSNVDAGYESLNHFGSIGHVKGELSTSADIV